MAGITNPPGGSGSSSSSGTRMTVALWEATRGAAPYYLAHRGSGDIYPEHSLAGYEAAYQAGARAMEVSVVRTADGVLMCNHDLTWTRTTTLTGSASAFPTAALRGVTHLPLGLGPAWTTHAERPPLFEDVLRRFGGRAVLICEAKDDAAYPAMMAMVERYGLSDCVMVKAFYTSSRIAQAKAAGYKTFSYFGVESDITSGNIATVVAQAPSYFVIPTYGATATALVSDANVALCVASGLPVWVYQTHRRADAAHMAALGVVGVVSAGYPYVARSTAFMTRDSWAQQAIVPGELTVDPSGAVAGAYPQWVGTNVIRLARTARHFLLLGQLCPLPAAAGSYTITFDASWQTLPADLTTNLQIAFGRSTDDFYEFQFGRGSGNHAMLRANGSVQLYTHADGSTSGTQIGTTGVTLTSTPVAGTWYACTLAVTPTTITWTVNDGTAHTVTVTNSTYRGGYVHIGKGSTDGVVDFRNLIVT